MSDLLEDLRRGAEAARHAFGPKGYLLDYSFDSLGEIDRFFDAQAPAGRARPGGELTDRIPGKLFSLGAYVGETLIRSCGGSWRRDPAHSSSEIHVQVVLPGGAILSPIRQVMRRFKDGPEAGIHAHALELLGGRSPRRRKPWRWPWPFRLFARSRHGRR